METIRILIGYISNKTASQLERKASTGGYAKVCRVYSADELSKMKDKSKYTGYLFGAIEVTNLKAGNFVKYTRNGTVFHARITLIGSTGIVFLDNGQRVALNLLEKQ